MTATYYATTASYIPPSPLGYLGDRWHLEHCCHTCRQTVPTDQLIAHAKTHDRPQPLTPDATADTISASTDPEEVTPTPT